MDEVKRYTVVECRNDEEFWAKMKEVKHGDYVLHSDYKHLEQQKAELIQSIESALNKSTKGGWLHRIFENIIEKYNIKI